MKKENNDLLKVMAEEIAKLVEAKVEYLSPMYFLFTKKTFGRHPIVILDKGSPLRGLDLSKITRKYEESLGGPIIFSDTLE